MQFEWDPRKGLANETKHSVSFVEASEVFNDDHSSAVPDPDHSNDEGRYLFFWGLENWQFFGSVLN